MTGDIDAVLARATADYAAAGDIMLIAVSRMRSLEAAARVVVAQSVTLDSNNEAWCLICASPAASHGLACPVVALAALLGESE